MNNAANRKDIREAEKAAKLRAQQDAEAVIAIMSTIPGRAWMWRQLGAANIFVSNFTGDPMRDAFASGERNFGLRLLSDIMLHCPEQYLQMTREANDNDRHHNNDRNSDTSSDASALAERRSGSIADGGDSGSDLDPAEGSESSAEAGGWNLVPEGYDCRPGGITRI